MRSKILIILNIVSFIGTLVVNTLANALPINGKNTGELSALYPNEFVPAGYTFSIWLVIYLALSGFVIYQAGGFTNTTKERMVDKLGVLFILTNLFNMGWILLWHYEQVGASVVIMLAFLVTLITIHLRFNIPDRSDGTSNKLWFEIPFSIYLGWIMIATIANITAWLVDQSWKGGLLSESAWAVIMITIAAFLCILILWKRRNYVIPMVAIWSIAGIMVKQRRINGWNDVVLAGSIACSLLILAILVSARRKAEKLQVG
jgi:benzodiazapine receptor